MKIKKVLVVINPVSGGVDKADLFYTISMQLRQNRQQAILFETTGHYDVKRLRQEIERHKPDAIVAAGGDGTVHLAAKALRRYKLPLAIIPLGSGNGLSKDLGIPQNMEEALQVLQQATLCTIDTLLINKRFCVHIMDLGFNALVVKGFDQADTRGAGTYIKVALQQYLDFEPKYFEIESDGGAFSGKAFMITVTNANQFGSNATVNPHGILNDGVFEICIIEPFPKAAAMGILYQLYNDTIHTSEYTKLIRCTQALIRNPEHELMQIDGETVPAADLIKVKVKPLDLMVLLPKVPGNML